MASRLAVRLRSTPWWARVVVVWLLTRLLTTAIILVIASTQEQNPWTGPHPPYLAYSAIWDGNWYKIVSFYGYPSTLPITDTGHVGENAWAFMPGFPFLVSLLRFATGGQWEVLALGVSVVCGLAAALVFYRLMRHVLGAEGQALFAVLLFCVAPVSPLLQLSYAESMYLLLLVIALYLVVLRRYGWLFLVVPIMAFTRPSGLAFALFLVLHTVVRFVTRARDPYPLRQRVLTSVLAVYSGLLGLAWPAIAWLATGDLTAYTDTELAWRAPYIGYVELVPFTAWFQGGNWWLGAPLGAILVVVLIALFVAILFSPWVKRLGVDLRLWVGAYGVYLLAVFFPQSSTFRLLMPMFPLLGAAAVPRSIVFRVLLVIVSVALQIGWLLICWAVYGADWTPP
ncbi:hypothetical protein DVJ78_09875 [Humibacter sp. BT305]|nr:hypothetical protein DVJ78_09875 [Humibacter sp. BT305]